MSDITHGNTYFWPTMMQTASVTTCTSSGGLLKTRNSAMSALSREWSAFTNGGGASSRSRCASSAIAFVSSAFNLGKSRPPWQLYAPANQKKTRTYLYTWQWKSWLEWWFHARITAWCRFSDLLQTVCHSITCCRDLPGLRKHEHWITVGLASLATINKKNNKLSDTVP